MVSNNIFCPYVLDNRYANDKSMLCRSYKILESDLKKVFEYIEPSDDNLSTYSHRTYELLLRAATEFESNCKIILEANGYTMSTHLNITHYCKIDKAAKLSEYEVCLDIWRPQRKIIRPFQQWQSGHSLSWYQAYNDVKHNRQINFNQANVDNLVQAVAGVYALLFAQFGVYSFNPYQQINMVEDNDCGSMFSGESVFSIIPPNWPDIEKYDFDWDTLKTQTHPFSTFTF
jgi:hypothetical protein